MTWNKVTPIVIMLLCVIVGYIALDAERDVKCRVSAIEMGSYALISIVETKWTFSGCLYLVRWNHTDAVTWFTEDDLAVMHGAERMDAQ